jgi:2-oxoisovalerate dehydrogenase E1 component alpha subunit
VAEDNNNTDFKIPFYKFLDENGNEINKLPSVAEDKTLLQKIYRTMVYTRIFDKKAIALQRTGKLGTYPSTLGQEAICTGIGAAMQEEDVLCPYYREYGAQFWRGVKAEEILLYWGGDERGSDFENNPRDFPICVPIASQNLHGVGVASAMQYQKKNTAVVTTVGDGGTSRGDFYEAINVAGVWNLPIVFVVNNNQWAISVPREKQTKAQTIAQKAFAAGIQGWQVDGNDIIAMTDTMQRALKSARAGNPIVIEAITYRMCDHTTADDASRYRPVKEIEANKKYDPIDRLRKFMLAKEFWSENEDKQLMVEIAKQIDESVEIYLNTPVQPPESMFDYLYAELPEQYKSQRQQAVEEGV